MHCNIFVLTHLSLYAKDIWKIRNNRTEHELLPFRRNNIWLGCSVAFILGNILHYFSNGRAASKASTKDSSLFLLPSTSTSFWLCFSSSLNSAHFCFVSFGLTIIYPVAELNVLVAVDTHLFSRDFGAWDSYKVPSLRIEDSDEWIIENITLPSLFLERSQIHYIGLMPTILREGKQAVARLSQYVFWQICNIWRCEVLVRLRWNGYQRKKTLHGLFEGHTSQICSIFSPELITMYEWRP